MVCKHLQVVPVSITGEFRDLELLCFDLIVSSYRYCFFVVYRPPGFESDAIYYMTYAYF